MEPHDRDQFDDLLDGALRQYGNVEPRAELEGRVLANLAANRHQATGSRTWTLMWEAAALAGLVVVVVWIGVSVPTGRRSVASPQVPLKISDENQRPSRVIPGKISGEATSAPRLRQASIRKPEFQVATAPPRLERFPSPRLLSEQEKLLVAYVSEYPKQAAEMAQEQADQEKELEAKYPVLKPDSDASQER
jgi:hypothetical protein